MKEWWVNEINTNFVDLQQGFWTAYTTYIHKTLKYLFLEIKFFVGSKYIACDFASIGKTTELIKTARRPFECPAVIDSGSREDTLRGEEGWV